MTKAQERLLNEIKDEYARYQRWFDENGGVAMDGVSPCWWLKYFEQGLVEIQANTKTVDILEELGYIEIVERREKKYGKKTVNWEIVRLLDK